MVRPGAKGSLSEDAATTRRSGTALAMVAWVEYLERLAERMQLNLMRAELARARSEAQESRKWAQDLVIRARDVSRDIVSSQDLTPCIDQGATRHLRRGEGDRGPCAIAHTKLASGLLFLA
jgi:hypothetical protein